MKQYRIGDYAKYLGVTPDLLKHYEDQGLITPHRSESGYRYYPFHTTMLLIESIRLRNYGFTLREIKHILTDDDTTPEEVEQRFALNIESLRQEVQLDQLLIDDYEDYLAWRSVLKDRTYDWEIRRNETMYFLPHTNGYDFLDDPRIYDLLKDWMSYIPIVKSCMRRDENGAVSWGFVIDERRLRQLRLPTNSVVVKIPPTKIFYCRFCLKLAQLREERQITPDHPIFHFLSAMNLTPADTFYRVTLMPAHWNKAVQYHYGYYAIPLKDAALL